MNRVTSPEPMAPILLVDGRRFSRNGHPILMNATFADEF
jgi:hypothetical protein